MAINLVAKQRFGEAVVVDGKIYDIIEFYRMMGTGNMRVKYRDDIQIYTFETDGFTLGDVRLATIAHIKQRLAAKG
jgi:hypothetical protein